MSVHAAHPAQHEGARSQTLLAPDTAAAGHLRPGQWPCIKSFTCHVCDPLICMRHTLLNTRKPNGDLCQYRVFAQISRLFSACNTSCHALPPAQSVLHASPHITWHPALRQAYT